MREPTSLGCCGNQMRQIHVILEQSLGRSQCSVHVSDLLLLLCEPPVLPAWHDYPQSVLSKSLQVGERMGDLLPAQLCEVGK